MIDDIIIVGGGISGLSCAYFLQKFAPSISCRILEASPRLGGSISTFHLQSGQLYESGPRSLRFRGESSIPTYELLELLGLEKDLIRSSSDANNRFVVLDGAPVALPSSLYSLFATPLGRHLLVKTLLESFQKPSDIEDESVASFFSRRAPSATISKLVDALCSGIWGGDPNNLSIMGTFPELKKDELTFGSVVRGRIAALSSKKAKPKISGIYSLKKGLGSLIESLRDSLAAPIQTNSQVLCLKNCDNILEVHTPGQIYRAKKVVMAIPEPAMRQLYPPLFGPITPLASFATVVMGFKNRSIPKKGYGILAPSTEDPRVLGIVYDSCVFREQYNAMTARLSVIIGGARWPNVVDAKEEDLYALSRKAVCAWVGIDEAPDEYAIIRSNNSIPQMPVGCKPLQPYRSSVCNSVIAIGPSIGGVSVNQCIAGAYSAATHLIH
jgi:protoporphyrinogen/coproporphyrinogen III oxidase